MRQEFRQTLLQQGYSEMTTNSPNIDLFFQKLSNGSRAVLWITQDEKLRVTQELVHQVQSQTKEYLKADAQFTIVEIEDDELIGKEDIYLSEGWFIDDLRRKLIVYEYQPADFYGLRASLEQTLDRKVKRTGKISYVNTGLVIINIVVFIILELLGDTTNSEFMLAHGAMYPAKVLENGEYYRLFTEMFIHFGLAHLFNNMMVLFFLGDTVERAVGKIRYLVIYLLSGLCGSVLSYGVMLRTGDWAVSGGASGAIFGMIGALLAVVIKNRGRVEQITVRRLLFMIILSLYLGYSSAGVDNFAHLGGLVAGFLMAIVIYQKEPQRH